MKDLLSNIRVAQALLWTRLVSLIRSPVLLLLELTLPCAMLAVCTILQGYTSPPAIFSAKAYPAMALPSAGFGMYLNTLVCGGDHRLDSGSTPFFSSEPSPLDKVASAIREESISIAELAATVEYVGVSTNNTNLSISHGLIELASGLKAFEERIEHCPQGVDINEVLKPSPSHLDVAQFRESAMCQCKGAAQVLQTLPLLMDTMASLYSIPPSTPILGPFAAVSGACIARDSQYNQGSDYIIIKQHLPVEDCEAACIEQQGCTGFEYPDDKSYCWLWLHKACSGSNPDGWAEADDNYHTYFLAQLGAPGEDAVLNETAVKEIVSSIHIQLAPPSVQSTLVKVIELLAQLAPSLQSVPRASAFGVVQNLVCGVNRGTASEQSIVATFLGMTDWALGKILWAPSHNSAVQQLVELVNTSFATVEVFGALGLCVLDQSSIQAYDYNASGLVIERWYGVKKRLTSAGLSQFVRQHPPDGTWAVSGDFFQSPRNIGDWYVLRMSGLFIPWADGEYRFIAQVDDVAVVSIGSNESWKSTSPVFTTLRCCTYFTLDWKSRHHSKSKSVSLKAGKAYFIELIGMEYTGQDFFEVGVIGPGRRLTPLPIMGNLFMPAINDFGPWKRPVELAADPGMLGTLGIFMNDMFVGVPNEASMLSQLKNSSTALDTREFVGGVIIQTEPSSRSHDIIIRLPDGATPSTSARRVAVSTDWGSGTWFDYLYGSPFSWLQDGFSAAILQTTAKPSFPLPTFWAQQMPSPQYAISAFSVLMAGATPLLLVMGGALPLSFLVQRLVYERESCIRQSLLVMGVSPLIIWVVWFLTSMLEMSLIAIGVTLTVKFGGVFPKSDAGLLWLFFEAFFISSGGLGMFLSVCFNKARAAASWSWLIYFLLYVPFFFYGTDTGSSMTFFSCMCPPTGLAIGLLFIERFEQQGDGLSASLLSHRATQCDGVSLSLVIGALVFSTTVFLLLGFQINSIRFDRNNTCLTRLWKGVIKCFHHVSRGKSSMAYVALEEFNDDDSEHFSGDGITIKSISKRFPSTAPSWCSGLPKTDDILAIQDLTLHIERGCITTLLGHNGSGKTTLVSILTGLLQPTSGSAWITSHSISTEMKSIRSDIGVCPQHNILFSSLSVLEHMWLATRLRKIPDEQAALKTNELLDILGLTEHKTKMAPSLSGGMKRKLCLAMALVGNPSTLILDEPTAGMDPKARRSTWDVIRSCRKDKTILLITHHMDECDVLSDRVAVMDSGRLLESGTPLAIKNKYGGLTGVRTQLATNANPNDIGAETNMTMTNKKCDDVYFQTEFKTPSELSELAKTLQAHQNVLNYSFVTPTLEDAFMNIVAIRAQEDAKQQLSEEKGEHGKTAQPNCSVNVPFESDKDDALLIPTSNDNVNEGLASCTGAAANQKRWGPAVGSASWRAEIRQQGPAIVKKRWLTWRRDRSMLLVSFGLPPVFYILAIVAFNLLVGGKPSEQSSLELNPDNGLGQCVPHVTVPEFSSVQSPFWDLVDTKSVYYQNLEQDDNFVGKFDYSRFPAWCGQNCEYANNMSSYFLQTASDISSSVHGAVCAASLNSSIISEGSLDAFLGWFNALDSHALPIFQGIIVNSVYKKLTNDPEAEIKVYSHPMPPEYSSQDSAAPDWSSQAQIVSIFLVMAATFVPAGFAIDATRERASGAMRLQIGAGLPVFRYWFLHAAWDYGVLLLSTVEISIIMAAIGGDLYAGRNFGVMLALWLLYGWAMAPGAYLLSQRLTKPTSGFVVFMVASACLATVIPILHALLHGLHLWSASRVVRAIGYCIPPYAFEEATTAVIKATSDHIYNQGQARSNGDSSPPYPNMSSWKIAGRPMFFLFALGCIGHSLLILTELVRDHGSLKLAVRYWLGRSMNSIKEELEPNTAGGKAAVSVQGLVKQFRGRCGGLKQHLRRLRGKPVRQRAAVDGVSFQVKQSSCFGLLGLNGAGKSTTFKILTGELHADEGQVEIFGHSIKSNAEIRSLCGYCPQYYGLCEFLTPYEAILLYGALRGIQKDALDEYAKEMIPKLGLTVVEHREARLCSVGNRRRISVAVALIGQPKILFLDEPTAGMDAMARRLLWQQIQAGLDQGQSIVLTSHSMDECEQLCDNLCVLKDGVIVCQGSPLEVAETYGQKSVLTVMPKGDDTERLSTIFSMHGAEVAHFDSGYLHCLLSSQNLGSILDVLAEHHADGSVCNWEVRTTSLDDVFVELTSDMNNTWSDGDLVNDKLVVD